MNMWKRVWNFFSSLLNWDPQEAEKKKQLGKVFRYLSTISPSFINKNTREILPGFAKILFAFTRYLLPIRNVFEKTILSRDFKMAELYRNYLIESYLPESDQLKRHSFTFDALKERLLDSVSGKVETDKIKYDFNEYIKIFNASEFDMINKELNEFYKLVTVSQHNYEPFLSLFDQELIISSNTYTPKFKVVNGNDIIPDLMDLYYITANLKISDLIEHKLMQLIERLNPTQVNTVKKKVSRLLARIDKILKTYLTREIILALLQAIKLDPEFVADTNTESVNYIDQYKSKLTNEFKQMIDRILREISENNIVQEMDELFQGEKLVFPEGYNETERDYLLSYGMESFIHIKPFTILKNYLISFFSVKTKNVLSKLIFEGFFEDKVFQNNISNAFYACGKSYNRIEQFETGLTEKATSSLLTIHNSLQKKERDKDLVEKLNNIIIGINQRVFTIIEEETNKLNTLLKYYTDVLVDYKNKTPLYISNIKVIGGNKNNEFVQDLVFGYSKLEQVIKIMKNFTVIKL
ncbi:MAG: DUF5312 family protein [Candidatus Pacearchaeota archaeon]|nr:DUF5312 family protein [Candidatus Pacearchaeota archaeon]